MIALNFDALGGNNYSHLDTSSFCLLYIDRRDNETHLPTRCWWLNEPIRLPLRSPSFRLCKFLPLHTCASPSPVRFFRCDLTAFDSIRFDSCRLYSRGMKLFSPLNFRKGREGEIEFFFYPRLRKHVLSAEKTFYNRCCNCWNRESSLLLFS